MRMNTWLNMAEWVLWMARWKSFQTQEKRLLDKRWIINSFYCHIHSNDCKLKYIFHFGLPITTLTKLHQTHLRNNARKSQLVSLYDLYRCLLSWSNYWSRKQGWSGYKLTLCPTPLSSPFQWNILVQVCDKCCLLYQYTVLKCRSSRLIFSCTLLACSACHCLPLPPLQTVTAFSPCAGLLGLLFYHLPN